MSELMTMASLPRQRLGLYLCENQGWERIFIRAWRKHGHGKLIGVAHSTIGYWDMRYFDQQDKLIKLPFFLTPNSRTNLIYKILLKVL